ncbi:hypothetical protein [Salinispora arenicola]|uniref:hypothetical protein n=1 Tax=Salinispora arenicola TaxID=168697 RepID=UPI0012BBD3FD|nr:hypothetical protein [Salinispora arenicola]MCN0151026.1 hypothetical protein [Salinispora arenicola]
MPGTRGVPAGAASPRTHVNKDWVTGPAAARRAGVRPAAHGAIGTLVVPAELRRRDVGRAGCAVPATARAAGMIGGGWGT